LGLEPLDDGLDDPVGAGHPLEVPLEGPEPDAAGEPRAGQGGGAGGEHALEPTLDGLAVQVEQVDGQAGVGGVGGDGRPHGPGTEHGHATDVVGQGRTSRRSAFRGYARSGWNPAEGTPAMSEHNPASTDFYRIDDLLTDAERDVRDRVRAFCDKEVTPVINDYWERAEFPFERVPKLAALNLAGGTITGCGCPGLSTVAAGLAGMELGRGDGSICTFFGVHSGLAMTSIALLGNEEQKRRWLPAMASMELIGAFGLTEPDPGSGGVAAETSGRRGGGHEGRGG